jgi:PAS domain S-box-containing protein
MSGFGVRRRSVSHAAVAVEPAFLAIVLEDLVDAVVIVGPDGLVRSNRRARERHGLPREPLAQEDWAARLRVFVPGSDRALELGELPLVRALRDQEASAVELEIAPPGQGRERFAVDSQPIRRGRRVIGALSVERRLPRQGRERFAVDSQPIRRGRRVIGALSVERRLPPSDASRSALLHPELLRHAPDGIAVICAETGAFVYTNDAWTNALGYAPGDLAGRHVSSVTAPSDRLPQEIAGEMLAVLDRGEIWRGEVELRRRDGVAVWWEQTVARYDDEQGRPAWIIVGREVSARRATVAELGVLEHRFHAAFDALPVPAAICDEDGRVLAVNDALVELTRTGRTELLGRALEAVLLPVDLDAERALAVAGRAGDVTRYRYDARPAGSGTVGVTTTVVRHVDGRFQEAVVVVDPDQPSSSTS